MSNSGVPLQYHNHTIMMPPPYPDTGYTLVPNVMTRPTVELGSCENSQLNKFPGLTNCHNCKLQVSSNVEKKLSSGGWAWAILCCCCGSWLLSLLVLCMDCFSDYIHYCPRCMNKLAIYSTEASLGTKCLLTLASIGVIALQVVIIVVYILPMFNGEY